MPPARGKKRSRRRSPEENKKRGIGGKDETVQ